MDLGEVLRVLADLTEASCAVWVAGGWGVDALVGQQTWLHRDLDLTLDARDEPVARRALERRGYLVIGLRSPPDCDDPAGVVDLTNSADTDGVFDRAG
jgi:hypothetical protein